MWCANGSKRRSRLYHRNRVARSVSVIGGSLGLFFIGAAAFGRSTGVRLRVTPDMVAAGASAVIVAGVSSAGVRCSGAINRASNTLELRGEIRTRRHGPLEGQGSRKRADPNGRLVKQLADIFKGIPAGATHDYRRAADYASFTAVCFDTSGKVIGGGFGGPAPRTPVAPGDGAGFRIWIGARLSRRRSLR
jgi:hypothetical protein